MLTVFFSIGQFAAHGQQQDTMSLRTIINKTIKLSTDRPFEKVYLHFDKPYYAVSDTIWFKAYLTLAQHQPSILSKVVYVDVISNTDSLVENLRIPVFNGVAYGFIPLLQTRYKQGSYHIRAYTNWMANFEPVYFFNKTINIGNALDKPALTNISFSQNLKNGPPKTVVQIHYTAPEGYALANKKVTWEIVSNPEPDKPLKGKDVTDKDGFVNINLLNNKLPDLNTSAIVATLDMGNHKTATNTFALRNAGTNYDVQFFAEGGNVIAGLRTRMAIKALKPDGLGVDIKGTVVDNTGKTAADFTTQHLGMGSFYFVPEAGKTYKANVSLADGTTRSYDLPVVQPSGIGLSVINTNTDTLIVKIQSNQPFFDQNQDKPFYIVAQSGGIIYFAGQTNLQSQVYSANIAKSKFPSGILQITLFASNGKPLCERITFIRQNDLLNIKAVTSPQNIPAPRKKMTFSIKATAKGLPVESNLSVSVVDESKVPYDENSESTILSNLLLTSDLKGYIEKPNYYFNPANPNADADLDVLMLTQGYRRFAYTDILADKYPNVFMLPEQGIDITGTLRRQNGIPVFKGSVRMLIPARNYSTETITDADGNFRFKNVFLLDSQKVTLNARNNVNANFLMMTVNPSTMPGITPSTTLPDEQLNMDTALNTYLLNSKKIYANSHVLKEVEIKSTVYVKKASHADYPALMGLDMEADHTLNGTFIKDCNDFATCIQGMLMGVTYDNNNFYVTRDYNQGKKTPMQIYLGDMPVDYTGLASVDPKMVESVEIFNTDGVSGINRMTQTNGVLVINMKVIPKGVKPTAEQLKDLFPPPYLLTFVPKGYNMAREFYSPKYTGPISLLQRADLRSTIYWNPKVLTDKTGTTSIEFYNADNPGTYKVTVEGFTADGNIGRYVYRYQVR